MHKEVKAFIRTFSIIFPIGAVLVLTYGYFNGNFDSEIPGCMDSKMSNYNPEATIEDGSCISALYGCTKTTAINYNSEANTDDGSCIQPSEARKNEKETRNAFMDNPASFKGKEIEMHFMMYSQRFPESVGYHVANGKGGIREFAKWANEDGIPVMFGSSSEPVFINIPPSLDLPNEGSNSRFFIKFKCNDGDFYSGNTAISIKRQVY